MRAVVVVVAFAAPGWAQVFSPGPLAKPHAQLEGLGNCTQCHGEGSQHDNARCLECHGEIDRRRSQGRGYHAKVRAQLCAECHREHRGVDVDLITWPGAGTQRSFDHRLTGWPLLGKHKGNDCKKCHEPRRVVDDDARRLQADKGRATLLGLAPTCVGCHFDEHRDQEGERCDKCHTPEKWKPAPLFDHNKMSVFALTGRHKQVACTKCHVAVVDDGVGVDDVNAAGVFPAPRDSAFLQMKPVPHARCTECHDDPHRGNFGRNCVQCHSTAGWPVIKVTAEDTGFHDKTRYPLRGAHVDVNCRVCHGPFRGQPAVFKGLKHERCADCHADAHAGQIAVDAKGAVRCEQCHVVDAFVPATFDVAAHDKTRFPLEGGHRAIACTTCHTRAERLVRNVPKAVRARLEQRGRPLLASAVQLDLPGLKLVGDKGPMRCESCHDDVHAGQFDARIKARGCNACHDARSFKEPEFDHDGSRFPLLGKHKRVDCVACHARERRPGKPALVRYRPLPFACADCHVDEHLGQLGTDCARCHGNDGFKPSTFDHVDPRRTRFVLEGRHQEVACAKCHVAVQVAGVDRADQTTSRYRPVPMECATCHDDEHQTRFDGFAP
ncbi:MAG: cytochrome c3 family protein [Deltaproteobacteria bacterium]|nr:cytochrome c3 family protein [Deltaproteobacteria bacterium]